MIKVTLSDLILIGMAIGVVFVCMQWVLAVLAMTAGAAVTALVQEGVIQTTAQGTRSVETWATWGTTVVGLVVALKFTAWYPDAYAAKQRTTAPA